MWCVVDVASGRWDAEMLNNSKWSRVNIDKPVCTEGRWSAWKQTMQYIYPHCINMFAFDYLIGISRVTCLGCVDEYLLQKSFRNTFSQKRVAYDCDSSTKMKKKRRSDAEKQVSSVLQSSLIRRGICCVLCVCLNECTAGFHLSWLRL